MQLRAEGFTCSAANQSRGRGAAGRGGEGRGGARRLLPAVGWGGLKAQSRGAGLGAAGGQAEDKALPWVDLQPSEQLPFPR